jgi:hypothetical protein
MTRQEAQARFAAQRRYFEDRGVHLYGVNSFLPTDLGLDTRLASDIAMDALPNLQTDPNSAIMAMLTTYVSPDFFDVTFAPLRMAEYMGEEKQGTWTDDTAAFPVIEVTGEVSSYSDWSNNGMSHANFNWPQWQSYHFQTFVEYGDRELARASVAKLNWTAQLDKSAAWNLNQNLNLTYAYGVRGLQNYGVMNDPLLPAALTPAVKAAGGTGWYTAGGSPNATANEVYNDILAVITALVNANAGNVDSDTPMTMALSPASNMALAFTNAFGLNVRALLKDNFPNLKIVIIPQFGSQTNSNTQGNPAGNLLQVKADSIEGQSAGFAAYTEKLRTFPLVRLASAFQQKQMSGSWGTVIRMPIAFAQMLGV